MMLGENLDSEMTLLNIDVGMLLDGLDERALYGMTCIVGVMEDAEFGVSSFAMQVVFAIFILVEVYTPFHELANLFGGFGDDKFHGLRVGEPVARYHRVVDMFLEIIKFEVGYRRNAALCKVGVRFLKFTLTDQCHLSGMCYLEGVTHACDA